MKLIVCTILFSCFTLFAFSQKDNKQVVKGNALYKQQEYEKAAETYSKATELNSANPEAYYNLGNSLFRLQNLEAAKTAFDEAAKNAKSNSLKANANYNKGLSLAKNKQLPEAIQSFKDALKLDPTDGEARENLQKAINELKKEQQQKPKDEDKKDDQKKKNDPPPKKKDDNKMNKNQAEQMLNSLRQEEKQLQKNLQQKKQPTGSQVEDW